MSGIFTAIDLSQIPAPAVIEALDYEQILADMLADLRARDPAYTAIVESDPAYKILEVAAYRELILRQRVNSAARAIMLPYSTGPDLDNLVALLNLQRLVIIPANNNTIPPTAAVMESDQDLRRRALLAWESLSTAGPAGSYIYHALSAHPDVKDASAISPEPGQVVVTVLSRQGNGEPTAAVLNAVNSKLSAEDVRPLTDQVIVMEPVIKTYQIEAVLYLYNGPDSNVVIQNARQSARNYADQMHRLGYDVTLSGIYAALHGAGVQRVELTAPAEDIINSDMEAAFCTLINVQFGGRDA